MRSILNHVLTKKEKIFLVIVVLACLGSIWFFGIYLPIRQRIQAADTTELEDELSIEEMKALKIQSMQKEITANKEAGLPEIPSYNSFKEEIAELNKIFGNAVDFDFQFSEPEQDGSLIRRNVAVKFDAKNFEAAKEMVKEILNSPFRTMVHDLSISSNSRTSADHQDDIKQDPVTVTFLMTAYETSYGADTVEGLESQESTEEAGGLANADVSDLERSDLETAAEAVLEN